MTRFGWEPVTENGNVIALTNGACNVSLEPGGQVELSGAPLETLHDTCAEVHEHLDQVKQIGRELGIGMIGLGFNPKWKREDIPWMPKGRYKIMGAYMPAPPAFASTAARFTDRCVFLDMIQLCAGYFASDRQCRARWAAA